MSVSQMILKVLTDYPRDWKERKIFLKQRGKQDTDGVVRGGKGNKIQNKAKKQLSEQ